MTSDGRSYHKTTKQRTRHPICSVVTDSNAPALPSLSALTANTYIPTSFTSISTSLTPDGLPRAAAGSSKSVAQRRAVAPPLVVGDLRSVDNSQFDAYLRETKDEYDRWQRETQLGREGSADLSVDGSSAAAGVGLGVSVSQAVGPGLRRGKVEEELPSLDGVPQIFFDPNFNLSNPRTFDLVTERIALSASATATTSAAAAAKRADSPSLELPDSPSPANSSPAIPGLGPLTLADLATDQILQEKLSHYTAVIESHLVREIGLRSSSFFSALSNLQSLHTQGVDCLAKIEELQRALDSRNGGVGGTAERGLKVLRSQARRRGMERIEDALRSVEEVSRGVQGVQELVEAGEWLGALEVAEQIEELYYRHSSSGTKAEPEKAEDTFTIDSPTTAQPNGHSTSTATKKKLAPLNLTKVKALAGVPDKLARLRAQVAKSLEVELVGVLRHELEEGVTTFIKLGTSAAWKGKGKETLGSEDSSAYAEARERAKERVRPGVRALVRADGMEGAIASWRESVLRDVRAMVREHLPTNEIATPEEEEGFGRMVNRHQRGVSIDLTAVSEKSLSLAKNLRALTAESFLDLASSTYLGLLACIEVTQLHAEVLIELATSLREEDALRKARRARSGTLDATQPPISSLAVPGTNGNHQPSSTEMVSKESEDGSSPLSNALLSDISDVVHASAELANLRFSKVIGVRTEVHSHLSLEDFVDIFDASWSFVLACEVICQRMIVGLRGVMVGQSKAFLQVFHQRRVTDSAKVVEEEQWSPAEVGFKSREVVRLILAAGVSDPAELKLGERGREAQKAIVAPPADDSTTKQLTIEDTAYYAVPAVLSTLDVLLEYVKVVVNCSLLTTDTMSKLIEFLKAFNSRTCQVVLGAGAMRSAGLKNITAKHLALASQALSVMIALIPYMRETLRRHLNAKQAVMLIEFDKLKRDFQEHQNEIHAKLVAIMSDRLDVHCKALQAIDWEQTTAGQAGPSAYVEGLVKEHTTLHKVLSRFLHEQTVEFIMSQVCASLDARLSAEFGKIELKSAQAKEKLKTDAVFLRDKLGELKGVEKSHPGQVLVDIVEAKVVIEPVLVSVPLLERSVSSTSIKSNHSSTSLGGLFAAQDSSANASRTSFDAGSSINSNGTSPVVQQGENAPSSQPAAAPAPLARKKTMSERLAEIARRNRAPPAPRQETAPPPPVPVPAVAVPLVVEPEEIAPPPIVKDEIEKKEVTAIVGATWPPPPSADEETIEAAAKLSSPKMKEQSVLEAPPPVTEDKDKKKAEVDAEVPPVAAAEPEVAGEAVAAKPKAEFAEAEIEAESAPPATETATTDEVETEAAQSSESAIDATEPLAGVPAPTSDETAPMDAPSTEETPTPEADEAAHALAPVPTLREPQAVDSALEETFLELTPIPSPAPPRPVEEDTLAQPASTAEVGSLIEFGAEEDEKSEEAKEAEVAREVDELISVESSGGLLDGVEVDGASVDEEEGEFL